jgi:plasmid rolling circle replication initiator protein Rep
MKRFTPEFQSILSKYEKQKINAYRVAELLGDDYTFTDWGIDNTDNRYRALIDCGTFLGFSKEIEQGRAVYHLKASNFCRQRLCPMCQFRKSERMFANMLRVVKHLESDYRFVHMVLTIPNPRYDYELVNAVKILYKAFGILISKGKPKKAFKGVLRCLEISYNYENDTFHPHLHCLVAVKPSYFNDSKVYISLDTLRELWSEAVKKALSKVTFEADFCRTEHLLQCSLRSCKVGDYEGVAEVCKYCVKPLELDKTENDVQNKRVLLVLWHTLKGARFVQKYGVIKEAFKILKLSEEDEEATGDKDDEEKRLYLLWSSDRLRYEQGD